MLKVTKQGERFDWWWWKDVEQSAVSVAKGHKVLQGYYLC